MDVEIDPLLFLGLAQNAQRESASSNSSASKGGHHRGQNFTEKERLVLLKLVERFPAISCKRITMDMRVKKQQSWNKLTKLYNIQPGITRRTMLQLKTAWLNSRRMASRSANNTQNSEDANDTDLKEKDTELADKQELVNIIIKEPSDFKVGGKRIKHEALSDNEDENDDNESEQEEDNEPSYLKNEEQAKIKRVLLSMQQDRHLFSLKRKREILAIERETNMLKYEKAIHELTIKKLELEIKMQSDKNDQDFEKDNPNCNGDSST